MPKIERYRHEREPKKDQDLIIKVGRFRFYFQNYYTIISLVNDLLTGGLYFAGSLANLLDKDPIIGQILYILGGFFLLMRPILRIFRNVFFYDEEQFQEEVGDLDTEEVELGKKKDKK